MLARLRARLARPHVCDWRPDAIDPDDYRCWCGSRPDDTATAALIRDLKHDGP